MVPPRAVRPLPSPSDATADLEIRMQKSETTRMWFEYGNQVNT